MIISINFNNSLAPVTSLQVKDCTVENDWVWYVDMNDHTAWYRADEISSLITSPS